MGEKLFVSILLVSGLLISCSDNNAQGDDGFVKENYIKKEFRIRVRDGVRLFTSVYIPKDSSEKYPILMERTPYSVEPYGEDHYPAGIGPNRFFKTEKYIFVYQDVRGRHMSEGNFQEMTPAIDNKKNNTQVDESSDTWDTRAPTESECGFPCSSTTKSSR